MERAAGYAALADHVFCGQAQLVLLQDDNDLLF